VVFGFEGESLAQQLQENFLENVVHFWPAAQVDETDSIYHIRILLQSRGYVIVVRVQNCHSNLLYWKHDHHETILASEREKFF